jgi:hypothetical protein
MIKYGTITLPSAARSTAKQRHQYVDILLEAACVAEQRGNYLIAVEQFERAMAHEKRYRANLFTAADAEWCRNSFALQYK